MKRQPKYIYIKYFTHGYQADEKDKDLKSWEEKKERSLEAKE
jgi:hypothetical protein